jgi:hypothetical protein
MASKAVPGEAGGMLFCYNIAFGESSRARDASPCKLISCKLIANR